MNLCPIAIVIDIVNPFGSADSFLGIAERITYRSFQLRPI